MCLDRGDGTAAQHRSLAAALAAERAIARRGAADGHAISGGWALRDDARPDIWQLNRVQLVREAQMLGPADVAAVADRWLGDRPHRRVSFDDAASGEALAAVLQTRGWTRERAVVMVLDAGAGPRENGRGQADMISVRPISEAELRAFQPRAFSQDAGIAALGSGLPDRIAEAQAVLRAATPAVGFGAAAQAHGSDLPAATATLYLDDDVDGRRVAFIDQVATLHPFRERGLGTAVVTAAITHAQDWAADVIALFADADDWPQVMYAGLGFATVGHQVTVHREAA